MVIQYPHIGKLFTTDASVKEGDGKWTAGSLEQRFETKCRAEPAGSSQFITGQGGEKVTFKSIVYMPVPDSGLEIKPGSFFEVWDGETLKVKETVKQFSKGQLNARIWL